MEGKGKKNEKNLLGITVSKREDFGGWYTQVLTKAELISYTDVAGCYVLRPGSYAIWEQLQQFLDGEIKALGVRNCYFPIFISKAQLFKEADHIEGFSPEVAWVTKAGQSELAEPVAVRPTSETAMYPIMKNWIRSHRDLPLKLNQWCNVVRWEFKQTVPFLRTREFLWQEGHTAHANQESAAEEVLQILDLYARAYEEVLAVPVIKGTKSEHEKFAGALYTTTVEGFIPTNGRAIQASTSHHLGQNFSKMFGVSYTTDEKDAEPQFVWQNSWGFTTRSIGVSIMVHGDDKGLVLPPKVAMVQVVIIPLIFKKSAEKVAAKAKEIYDGLRGKFRVKFDDRDNYKPGWKYSHWELKGVPLRLEFGPKDMEKNCCVLVRRDTGEKIFNVALDTLEQTIHELLETMQTSLLEKARKERDDHIQVVKKWEDFVPSLNNGNMNLIPWCTETECELDIKKRSSEEAKALAEQSDTFQLTAAAKSLCIPFDQGLAGEDLPEKCPACNGKAKKWALFGRSY